VPETPQPSTGQRLKRGFTRRRLVNLGLILLLVLLVGVLMLMLAKRRPAFYVVPGERDVQVLIDDANAFSRKVQQFMGLILSDQDFALRLTDQQVNGYLAAANDNAVWEQLDCRFTRWREIFRSHYLSHVQVSFSPERVRAAGEVQRFGTTFIITLSGQLVIDEEGRVRLKVTDVTAGSLPIPRFFVRELLDIVDDRPVPARSEEWRVTSVEVLDGEVVLHGEYIRKKTTKCPGDHREVRIFLNASPR